VDSVNQPKDRNQALFRVNFLLAALRKLVTRLSPYRITGIIEEEPRHIPGDNPLKAAGLLFRQ
jgi:hypothetical protein